MATLTYNPSNWSDPGNIPISPPTVGSGTELGLVPGPIAIPDVAAQLAAQIPGLAGINSQLFGNLSSMAGGQIPQGDLNFLQDQRAAQAAASGMPGTNVMRGTLGGNQSARNLGLLQLQLQQQAAQMYPSLVGAVSQTQTVPAALQAQIAERNSTLAASPDPAKAQSYAQQLYNQALRNARGPGGGTGGPGNFPVSSDPGNSWFYQPMAGGGGTDEALKNRGAGYPGNFDLMDEFDPNTGGDYSDYSTYEGTPGFSGQNDTYTTPDYSYYDPYGFGN